MRCLRRWRKTRAASDPKETEPELEWKFNEDTLRQLDEYEKQHPNSTLNKLLEQFNLAAERLDPLIDLIPNAPVPAKALVKLFFRMAKLAQDGNDADGKVIGLARKIVKFMDQMLTIYRRGSSSGGYFPPEMWQDADEIKKIIDDIMKWVPKQMNKKALKAIWDAPKTQEQITAFEKDFDGALQRFTALSIMDIMSSKKAKDSEAILRWLLPSDPLNNYRDILRRRQGEGTAGWLLIHPKFKTWLVTADKTLWCPGMPGAGKTMHATIVVEYLFTLQRSQESFGVACVYFSHSEEQTLDNILLRLLKQLIRCRKMFSDVALNTYKSCEDGNTQPSTDQILEMLRSEVNSLTTTFIVVDALDECRYGVWKTLLDKLEELRPKIHLLVTSRVIGVIEDRLKGSVQLEISAKPEDVRSFIKAQIEDSEALRLRNFVTREPKLREQIEEAVITTAKGMFLLVRLHLESLTCALTIHEVRNTLKFLPDTVDTAYSLAIARIDNQRPESYRNFAYKVLSWIAYSLQPLSVDELLCALAIDSGDTRFDESKVPMIADITGLCAGLIIIDNQSQVVRLVHPTLRTYFDAQARRHDPRFSATIMKMAEICLTCVSFNTKDGWGNLYSSDEASNEEPFNYYNQSTTQDLPAAFGEYAIRRWAEHTRYGLAQSDSSSITNYVTSFLCDGTKMATLVSRMYSMSMCHTYHQVTGLHVAAKFGLTKVAKALLLAKHCDIDAQDGNGDSALVLAIESGHEETLNMLVDEGAFVDLFKKSSQILIILAAEKGYKIDRIFEKSSGTPQTTLLAAAYSSRDAEVAAIVQHPDLDLKGKDKLFGVTALLLAAELGSCQIIKTMLEHGVDVNAAGGNGACPSALHRAAGRGFVEIIKFLLTKTTVDLKDRRGNTAWVYSVREHHKETSDILRGAGADTNTTGADGWNILYHCAAGGYLEDVKFLLESGTNPSIETNFGWAPLHWAAAHGYYEIVELLLQYGANHSPLSDTGLTPLDKAKEAKQYDVVKMLENAGAKSGRNALVRTLHDWSGESDEEGIYRERTYEEGTDEEMTDEEMTDEEGTGEEGTDEEGRDDDGWR